MKQSEKALDILAQIQKLVEDEDYGENPEAKTRITGLIKILKMHASGFLPNDSRQIYLGEQVGKLEEYKEDLYSDQKPRFWQTHDECQSDMVTRCIIARGLIERHATDYEK